MTRTRSRAAAALIVEAERAVAGLQELMDRVRGCFARFEPWVQAREYVRAVSSDLPERNGWTIAEWIGDRTPDKTQRLLNHAVWDTDGVMSQVRRYAVAGLDEAAGQAGYGELLRVGALDPTLIKLVRTPFRLVDALEGVV